MSGSGNPYAVLGVERGAPEAAIRAAYLARIKDCHPDLSTESDRLDRFLHLQQAYACLRDPAWRTDYDAQVAVSESRAVRKLRRARRRLGRIDHRRPSLSGRPHRIAAIVVLTGGMLAVGALYFAG